MDATEIILEQRRARGRTLIGLGRKELPWAL